MFSKLRGSFHGLIIIKKSLFIPSCLILPIIGPIYIYRPWYVKTATTWCGSVLILFPTSTPPAEYQISLGVLIYLVFCVLSYWFVCFVLLVCWCILSFGFLCCYVFVVNFLCGDLPWCSRNLVVQLWELQTRRHVLSWMTNRQRNRCLPCSGYIWWAFLILPWL